MRRCDWPYYSLENGHLTDGEADCTSRLAEIAGVAAGDVPTFSSRAEAERWMVSHDVPGGVRRPKKRGGTAAHIDEEKRRRRFAKRLEAVKRWAKAAEAEAWSKPTAISGVTVIRPRKYLLH